MIVHLAGSLRDLDEDAKNLRRIIEVVHDHGGTISHNWLDAALQRHKDNVEVSDWTPFVENMTTALKRSDVVIIEATHYAFSQGFQMAAALEHQKPVLVVSQHRLKYLFITGFTDPLLSYATYSSEEELAKIVNSFLRKNIIHTKDLRFNLFITRQIARYLYEQSLETGKNKSEIVRDIIRKNQPRERL